MKRILLFICILGGILLISACGISQADYDAVIQDNSTLQAEIQALSDENDSLTTTVESLMKEKEEWVLAEMDDAYGKAWATTAFGENSVCIVEGDSYFQCIAENTYDISFEGISMLWADYLDAIKLLGTVSENVSYETISVKFLDPSGTYILDIIIIRDGDTYILDAIMCNALYSETITDALNNQ